MYPSDLERVIGFSEIRNMLRELCLTEQGKVRVDKMNFSRNPVQIRLWLDQSAEMLLLQRQGQILPLAELEDLRPVMEKLNIEGYYFFAEELLLIRKSLQVMLDLRRFIAERPELCHQLTELIAPASVTPEPMRLIDRVIDQEGKIRFNASRDLEEIHWNIEGINKQLEKKGQQLYQQAKKAGYTEETGLTIRDGRIVLPVLSEFRRKIRGIVMDESAQGRIAYIEPEELIELNNDLRELEMKRRREIERILREVTKALLPHREFLEEQNQLIGIIDFLNAKGRLGVELEAEVPELLPEPELDWKEARHPLLLLHHRKLGRKVVPLQINLNQEQRIVVISGPNAGGKSVCLKTVSLLQYMVQCGLPVTCSGESKVGVFRDIMVDIGDNQSIDNDLSSYTSHLQAMKHFAAHAGPSVLFCIDELGSGTDPQLGGPIAEGVLHWLNRKRAIGVVTTHFSSIKQFTGKQKGMVNAAMAYDVEALLPLYQLRIGSPGSSYAFEVAAQIGLQDAIVQYARKHSPVKQQQVEQLLTQLEKEKADLEFHKEVLQQKDAHLQHMLKSYEQLKDELKQSKKEILEQARQKASKTVEEANRRIEESLRQMRQEEKEKVKLAREQIKQEKDKLNEVFREEKDDTEYTFQEGDLVVIRGQQTPGKVTSVKKNKVWVDFNGINSVVQLENLRPVTESIGVSKVKKVVQGIDLISRQKSFSPELDVRGKRGEEVVKELEQMMDSAVILGFNRLRVIHGKGNGILKKLIREYFRNHPFIAGIHYEHEDLGGEGVSIIELR